nr:MMPL family transporter [Actinomycetota bacterium]
MVTTSPSLLKPVAARTYQPGLIARLGVWSTGHFRVVLVGWLVVMGVLGAFAPRVESALSGAGWQDSGSQSVQARRILGKEFAGLNSTALQVVVHVSQGAVATDPQAQSVLTRATALLKADHRISTVIAPQPGVSISQDGRTAILQAGANADANTMVRAADELAKPLQALSGNGVTVQLTGSSALWANFNRVNHSAMIRSEVLSWPVTMLVLVLAFGSLVAAGLPLMLTLVGLLSAAGALVIASKVAPVSIWAMNFAMMFALALGIDYALFIVVRFRAALARRAEEPDRQAAALAAVSETMGTAGKAVAFSGLTVLVSLSTVLLVPSPAFRSMSLGIMLSVVAVLAATLTLLPAVLGRLGPRVDAGRVRIPGALERAERKAQQREAAAVLAGEVQRAPGEVFNGTHPHLHHSVTGLERLLHHWGALLHRRPWAAVGLVVVIIGVLAWPVTSLRTGMPSIAIIPQSQTARAGYNEVAAAFGSGAPGMLSVLTPLSQQQQTQTALTSERGIAAVIPGGQSAHYALTLAMATTDASS